MIKNLLYVLCIIGGGFFLLLFLYRIPHVLTVMSSHPDLGYKLGTLIGVAIMLGLGIVLVRFGMKRLNPKNKKEKESIEDIGRNS